MNALPEPRPTTTDGQPGPTLGDAMVDLAVDRIIEQSRRDGTSPHAVIGATPPVQQPGRPAMSQRAVDASVLLIAGGWFTLCLGAAASAVLYFSGKANPLVVGLLVAALPATFFTLGRLVKKARHLPPREVHNHGPVYQTTHEDHSTSKAFSLTTRHDTTINPTPEKKGHR